MLGMGRLIAGYIHAEGRVMEPLGHQAAKPALSLWRIVVLPAMEGMAGKGRVTLAGDDEHGSQALCLGFAKKLHQAYPGHFDAGAVEIQSPLKFHLPAGETLCRPAIKTRDLRR